MLSPRLWLAPVVLFALQASPVVLTTDSAGRIRLTAGGGIGMYEERLTSCSGETLESYDVPFQQLGAQADVWVEPNLRVTGYAGAMFASSDRPALQQLAPLYQGGYGGVLVAGEWRGVGAGVGVSALPGESNSSGDATTRVVPAAYLRIGSLEGTHFRTDVFGPPGVAALPHFMRIGAGFGQGHLRRRSGFIGLGLAPFPWDDVSVGLVGDVLVPVSPSLDVGGAAAIRTSSDNGFNFNLGVQLRVKLGQPPR